MLTQQSHVGKSILAGQYLAEIVEMLQDYCVQVDIYGFFQKSSFASSVQAHDGETDFAFCSSADRSNCCAALKDQIGAYTVSQAS